MISQDDWMTGFGIVGLLLLGWAGIYYMATALPPLIP